MLLNVNGCSFIVLSVGEQLFRVAKYPLKQENLNMIGCNILSSILHQLNQCLTITHNCKFFQAKKRIRYIVTAEAVCIHLQLD